MSFRSQTATKKRVKTLKGQFAYRCCIDCPHRQDSTTDWRNDSASSQLAVPDSLQNQCFTAVAGATYSNNKVKFHTRDQHRQTHIRLTGFPTLTCDLVTMQDFYDWTSARARNLAVLAARVSVIGHFPSAVALMRMPMPSIFTLKHVGVVLARRVDQCLVKPGEELVFLPIDTASNPCTSKVSGGLRAHDEVPRGHSSVLSSWNAGWLPAEEQQEREPK